MRRLEDLRQPCAVVPCRIPRSTQLLQTARGFGEVFLSVSNDSEGARQVSILRLQGQGLGKGFVCGLPVLVLLQDFTESS